MADLHYKDNVYGNREAINNFGQILTHGRMAVAAQRMQQLKLQQQADIWQARLAEQEKLRRMQIEQQMAHTMAQQPMWQAQALQHQAAADTANQKRMAGQDLGFNIQQLSQAQQMPLSSQDADIINAIKSRVAQQQAIIAATHPANIGVQVPQITQAAVDPRMAQLIATGTKVVQPVSQGATLYDLDAQKPIFTSSSTALTYEQRQDLAKKALMGRLFTQQLAGASRQVSPGATPPDPQMMNALRDQAMREVYGTQSGAQRMENYAVNKQTGERIKVFSTDGGKTWNPAIGQTQSTTSDDDSAIKAPTLQY